MARQDTSRRSVDGKSTTFTMITTKLMAIAMADGYQSESKKGSDVGVVWVVGNVEEREDEEVNDAFSEDGECQRDDFSKIRAAHRDELSTTRANQRDGFNKIRENRRDGFNKIHAD